MNSLSIPHFVIDQIYLFIKERLNFSKKNNQSMIIDFLRELHDGPLSEFKFIEPATIIGNFGKVDNIVISFPPDFMDKELFLKWLDCKLKI